jgi:hypothetical protein
VKDLSVVINKVVYNAESGKYEVEDIKYPLMQLINGDLPSDHAIFTFFDGDSMRKFINKEYMYFKKYKGVSARKVIQEDPSYAHFWISQETFADCYVKRFINTHVHEYMNSLEQSLGEYYSEVDSTCCDIMIVSDESKLIRGDKNHYLLQLKSTEDKIVNIYLSSGKYEHSNIFESCDFEFHAAKDSYDAAELSEIFSKNIGKRILLKFKVYKNQIFDSKKVSRATLI